jgi:hypothetical protein
MDHQPSIWKVLIVNCIVAAFLATGTGVAAGAKEVPLISKEDLKPGLDAASLIIIDVRSGKDWNASQKKIKGAVREDPEKVEAWAKKYKSQQDIVLYCA